MRRRIDDDRISGGRGTMADRRAGHATVTAGQNPTEPVPAPQLSVMVTEPLGSPVIPALTSAGLLLPGDFEVSFDELRRSTLVLGPDDRPTWDTTWRAHLVKSLETLVRQLWQVGITEVYVDGSFAEDKDHPNDIDGYFTCDLPRLSSGRLERELNQVDPHKAWTWDPAARRRYRAYPKRQLLMWHHYRVELYPHVPGLGMGSGILDSDGNELEFPSAFRQSRGDGAPRGIVKLRCGTRS